MNRLFELLADLQQALDDERAALLSGRSQQIAAVAERKRALLDRIEAEAAPPDAPPPDPDQLVGLSRRNRENAMICAAMLRHLTQAVDKLRQFEPHRSYCPDGSERRRASRNPLGCA